MTPEFVPDPRDVPGAQIPYRTEAAHMNADKVLEVIHDLESWRAVEPDFESRKLIDDATKKLRAAVAADRPTPAEVAALDGT